MLFQWRFNFVTNILNQRSSSLKHLSVISFIKMAVLGEVSKKLKYLYILIEMFCFKLSLVNSFKCSLEELAHWIVLAVFLSSLVFSV